VQTFVSDWLQWLVIAALPVLGTGYPDVITWVPGPGFSNK